jgi:hypothetical protein
MDDGMLHQLRFRHLNILSPSVAAFAFAGLLFVIPWLGRKSMEHVERIRKTHIAAMQAAQRSDLLVSRLQRAFQDAGAASDAAGIEEAKRLYDELRTQLKLIRHAELRDPKDLDRLEQAVDRYYKLTAESTKALIAGSVSETVVSSMSQASATFDEIQTLLTRGTEADQKALDQAFEAAAEANRSAMAITMGVSFSCLVVLVALAIIVSRSMRSLVQEIVAVSAQINSAAAQMSAAANQHEQGASEQVSAVEETRRTMGSLVSTGDQVNAAIDVVLRNAEQTQGKNQLIGESITRLSGTTERIGETLESIRDIAHKSDLLALNAALEGTKAGEAGRGFSLVATQMQRLAENVMESVVNVKALTADIRRASGASVLATEEGTKLAQETTRSAREIRMVMQQYQAGTEQVSAAMNDISQVGQQSAVSSRQVHAGSKDLASLSERLLSVIERFRFDEDTRSGKS